MTGGSFNCISVFPCCTGSFQEVQTQKCSPFCFVSALEEKWRLKGPWEEEDITCEMGDSPQNHVMLVKILGWGENLLMDRCISVEHNGTRGKGNKKALLYYTAKRWGTRRQYVRQADQGEGSGQEQMGELFSRTMEKEHPKWKNKTKKTISKNCQDINDVRVQIYVITDASRTSRETELPCFQVSCHAFTPPTKVCKLIKHHLPGLNCQIPLKVYFVQLQSNRCIKWN